MGNKPVGYWIILLLAIAALVVSFMWRSSPDPHTRDISRYLWIGSVVLLLVARFFFRGKPNSTPPMPRD